MGNCDVCYPQNYTELSDCHSRVGGNPESMKNNKKTGGHFPYFTSTDRVFAGQDYHGPVDPPDDDQAREATGWKEITGAQFSAEYRLPNSHVTGWPR